MKLFVGLDISLNKMLAAPEMESDSPNREKTCAILA